MVKIENMSASYGCGKNILNKINFDATPGKITIIIGQNGSGKSSIVKAITRDIDITEGSISIDGHDIKNMSPKEIARHIAVVEQNTPDYRGTAKQYVMTGRMSKNSILKIGNTQKDEEAVSDAMDRIGISRLAERTLNQLSGGERQLCTIARAIAQDTNIVILDEPTTGLDIQHQIEIIETIKKMRDCGKTIICIIHDINIACNIADNILLIRNGEQIAFGNAKEIATEDNLTQAMGTEMRKLCTNDENTTIFVAQKLLNICEKV